MTGYLTIGLVFYTECEYKVNIKPICIQLFSHQIPLRTNGINTTLMPLLLALQVACNFSPIKDDYEWLEESYEEIQYGKKGEYDIEIKYTTTAVGLLKLRDTAVVIRRYQDTLLLEEIQYNIEEGDSIIWSESFKEYDSLDRIIRYTESTGFSGKSVTTYSYQEGKRKQLLVAMMPLRNDDMEVTGFDTLKHTYIELYDSRGNQIETLFIRTDEISSDLIGEAVVDSIMTFNQYNDKQKRINSVTVDAGDTIAYSQLEYDLAGNLQTVLDVMKEFGIATTTYEYDDNGNITLETYISDDFVYRTKTEYDALGRPARRWQFNGVLKVEKTNSEF